MQNTPGNGPVDSEALARARYAVYAQRRTMPPRCNPVGILLLVLTLGMVFIGLTMTIIANWPGATTIGENPLIIAGPVLLGCGGGLFVLTIVLIIYLNRCERNKWERQLTNLAADRINNASASREILVTRNQFPEQDYQPYKKRSSSSQADPDPSSSRGSGAYPVKSRYNVEMLPDPLGKQKQSGKFHDVSLDSEDKVPDPMRVQKKRPTSKKNDSSDGSFSNSYSSAGEADLGVPGMLLPSSHRVPQQTNNPNGGYINTSFESAGETRSDVRSATGQQRSRATKGAEMGGEGTGGGRHRPAASDQMRSAAGRGSGQLYHEDPQQLRIHIKAQPGTAVHITPTVTPTPSRHSRQMAGRTSLDTSGETEI